MPVSWLAPPVRMTRPRGSAANGEAVSRSRTISRISSTRGLMICTSVARDTNCGGSRSSPAARGKRDHVALVHAAGQHTAIERLDSLGVIKAGRQSARQIHGDVIAAEREAVGMDEPAAGEHRDGGGAGAHIDHRGADIGLVVGQRRQRRRHRGLPPSPRRRDGSARSPASGCGRPRDRRSPHACRRRSAAPACRADRGCRVASSMREADRQRMQQDAARLTNRALPAASTRAMSCSVTVEPLTSIEAAMQLAADPPGGNRHQHRFDLHLGGALGEIDGVADRFLGIDQIDHRAGLHAARAGMAEADHLDGMAAPAQRFALRDWASAARSGRRSCWCRCRARPPAPSAAATPASSSGSGRSGGSSCVASLLRLGLFLDGGLARLRRGVGKPHGDPVGMAQIDRRRCRATVSFLSRSSATSWSSARSTSASGSRTSMPFFSRRFQRRSATSIEARTLARMSG